MALHERAMLASLNISQWEGRKFDKKATVELEQTHQASNAGRFNKLLIDDAALKPIAKAAGEMRRHHDKVTLPWGDKGERLLPSRLYLQYTKDMRGYRDSFTREVDTFLNSYGGLVSAARKRLGSLYNAADYPDVKDISRRFGVEMSFMPVPSANDFRVDVAIQDRDAIRKDIDTKIRERQAQAIADATERAKVYVQRIVEVLSSEKPRIFDSLMGNVEELVSMLPAFNLLDDPGLTKLEQSLAGLLVNPDSLRNMKSVRDDVLLKARILGREQGWL
jgi:Protein of unknown function (DUF3150)